MRCLTHWERRPRRAARTAKSVLSQAVCPEHPVPRHTLADQKSGEPAAIVAINRACGILFQAPEHCTHAGWQSMQVGRDGVTPECSLHLQMLLDEWDRTDFARERDSVTIEAKPDCISNSRKGGCRSAQAITYNHVYFRADGRIATHICHPKTPRQIG